MLIAGADPGLDGAIAFLDTATMRFVAVVSMPALTLGKGKGAKRNISMRSLAVQIAHELIDREPPDCLFLEDVSSSPQMGVTSAFSFGRSFGGIEGIAAVFDWPIRYVSPAKWKRALGVPAQKDDAINRATQLLSRDAALWVIKRGNINAKQASGRAEAALIALYGARSLGAVADGTVRALFAGAAA